MWSVEVSKFGRRRQDKICIQIKQNKRSDSLEVKNCFQGRPFASYFITQVYWGKT